MQICEIYPGFDGEVNSFGQGTPTIFVRLQGCNLRCNWCDTPYAQELKDDPEMSLHNVLREITAIPGIKKVTITGGEPLLQMEQLSILIQQLFNYSYRITVETNGSISWDSFNFWWNVDSWIIDYKLPSSGENHSMVPLDKYVMRTRQADFIKFVVADREDFTGAFRVQKTLVERECKARFAYSAMTEGVSHQTLAKWLLDSPEILERAVLNVQLHKLLWDHERRR